MALDPAVEKFLALRRPGEWVAVKVIQIGAQVVGDESLPYIPATRTLGDTSRKAS